MLKKLIAHDFRCTWKITTLLYVTSVIAAVLSVVCDAIYVNLPMGEEVSTITILLTSGLSMASGLLTMLAFFCVCAVFLVSAVHYYKKMVSDEAYLTHTLPVEKRSLIFSKVFASTK